MRTTRSISLGEGPSSYLLTILMHSIGTSIPFNPLALAGRKLRLRRYRECTIPLHLYLLMDPSSSPVAILMPIVSAETVHYS
jgi:hypothetical protein